MNERERHVNQSLRALDDAHRLGRLSREEYRSRRRHLLGALRDSHVVTARNAIVRPAAAQQERTPLPHDDVLPGLFPPRLAAWKWALVLVAAVAVIGIGLAYWLSHAQ